jgi:outer membrane protein assembly factor BamA
MALLLFAGPVAASGPFSLFKDKELDFFPVPIFETRPDEGESYGVMPVLLFTDKETKALTVILAAIGQYNSITRFSGAAIFYVYPNAVDNPEEVVEFYFEYAQRYYREGSAHYHNPEFLEKFFLDTRFTWLKTPFPRFYGYGAGTTEAGQSNYVSRNFLFDTTFGYYIFPELRVNLGEKFTTTDLLTRAFSDVDDTLTRYGALPGVNDATHLIHTLSVTYDTRPKGIYSKRGTLAQGSYFVSIDGLLSDSTINGFNVEAIQLFPLWKECTVTALRLFVQDMYGTGIPFYLQSSLGGPTELRAFIPNRFTDTGKIIFTWEQRFQVLGKKLFGIPVEFYIDPFFEVGRVLHHIDKFALSDLQPVGGVGVRAHVPPNVVGRVDVAVGREGYSVYTMLGYPF